MFEEMAMDTTLPSTGGALLDGREATVASSFYYLDSFFIVVDIEDYSGSCCLVPYHLQKLRWRVHDLRVGTRGLVCMGRWRWIPPYLLQGVPYLRVVCLVGKEISLSDCSGAVVQDPGHSVCRHGDLHVCLIYSFLPGCRGSW